MSVLAVFNRFIFIICDVFVIVMIDSNIYTIQLISFDI